MKKSTNTEVQKNNPKSGVACTSVFVVDCNNNPLMPCTPRRARLLLKSKRADVYKMHPFTIRLLDREVKDSVLQEVELKIDPGSKTTGLALMVKGSKKGWVCMEAWELQHRGQQIKKNLLSRSQLRHSRRSRKTRYRKPRFLNRTRKADWLPPSLQSRIDNIVNFTKKMMWLVRSCAFFFEKLGEFLAFFKPRLKAINHGLFWPGGLGNGLSGWLFRFLSSWERLDESTSST